MMIKCQGQEFEDVRFKMSTKDFKFKTRQDATLKFQDDDIQDKT